MQSKFSSATIIIFQPIFFSLPKKCCFTILVARWIEQCWENTTFTLETEMRSRCLSMSQRQSVLCGWQSRPLIICLSWVASEGKMLSLRKDSDHKSNWSQLEQTALSAAPADVFYRTWLKPKMRHFFCFLLWKVVKFESERWRKASKGRCNWADLDRLPGNIKQQQLWRRVIASLSLCNALSSL